MRGRVKLARSRKHVARLRRKEGVLTYGQKLLAEYHGYYENFPLREEGEDVSDLLKASEMRARKSDWRARQERMNADAEHGGAAGGMSGRSHRCNN